MAKTTNALKTDLFVVFVRYCVSTYTFLVYTFRDTIRTCVVFSQKKYRNNGILFRITLHLLCMSVYSVCIRTCVLSLIIDQE